MSLPQSEIPRLSILYHAKRLIPSSKPPQRAPSATLNTRVGLIRSEITKLSLPNGAIVNAATTSLLNAGGICGTIHNAAGRGLLAECLTLGGCETGDAKITGAYELACRNVIHAVGPEYWKARKTNEHASLLASSYLASLRLAVENGLEAIAFPTISAGVFGYPSYEAAEVAISTVRDFFEREEQEGGAEGRRLRLVVFCTLESKDEIAYIELLPNYFPPAGDREDFRKSPEQKAPEETLPLLIFITNHVYSLHRIHGRSMSPTLSNDIILAQRYNATEGLRRGQVVLYRSPVDPERVAVKRVVGLEGDVVVVRPGTGLGVGVGEAVRVGPGKIPKALIEAKVTHVVWPPSRAGRVSEDYMGRVGALKDGAPG
ncbi:A1pp-domain-containing protein [Tuber magnatum]|uniref:Mitochondrial inner membrane protease subunit n=1 Tax=Tuber magnatum TaxID=42249 RepID=A0A317SFH1_9PEZI|nr:A1pp-domain-containing protein [Tuber magnatum]